MYLGLAAGLGMGAASEIIRRSTGNSETASGSLLLSASNVSRLVDKLSKMRGAALKLGQFMSIQGQQLIICAFRVQHRFPTFVIAQTRIYCPSNLRLYCEECKLERITCRIGKWR